MKAAAKTPRARKAAVETHTAMPVPHHAHGALDLLLPYQKSWVALPERFKIWVASRQVGKSFACAAECVLRALRQPQSHTIILSSGERAALEFMEKVRQWAEAVSLVIADFDEARAGAQAVMKAAEVRFANGSRITALPANPATARGYSAHVVLDEFAFHDDPTAIWRAVFPIVSSPFKGSLTLSVVSTPQGLGNKFYDLVNEARQPGSRWGLQQTTIHDAVAAGLPDDREALRAGAGDADTWAQEYECVFLDAGGVLFTYEALAACEDSAATLADAGPAKGPRYVGVDVGTVNDPTVAVTLERTDAGKLRVVEVLRFKGMTLPEQEARLRPLLRAATRCGLDATGLGTQLGQTFARELGGKFQAQTFTAKWKAEAFPRLLRSVQDRLLGLPVDKECREDMHAWAMAPGAPFPTYWAPRTKAGHSDFTSALLLAHEAAMATAAGTIHRFGTGMATRRELTQRRRIFV